MSKRILLLAGGLGAIAGAALVGLSVAAASWADTAWQDLPAVDSLVSSGGSRPVRRSPDAWAIASAVWERPAPLGRPSPPPETPVSPVVPLTTAVGYLTVVVEPWARVDIDGSAVGETPLAKIELPAGAHRITLSNDRIVGVIRDDIVIGPGESSTKRYSFNDTGYLSLVVTPWADVSIDGRSIGQTPLGRVAVPAGSHTVSFVHPELGVSERTVTIVSGQTTLVKVQLQ